MAGWSVASAVSSYVAPDVLTGMPLSAAQPGVRTLAAVPVPSLDRRQDEALTLLNQSSRTLPTVRTLILSLP